MVTESRFSDQAAKLGLLPSDQEGAIAVLEVRDPGSPLVEGQPLRTPPKTWPLTWAVADVVAGREGVNANGYRNYRGLDVVGAWRWMPEWNVGVVTEIGHDEAYETLTVVRRAFRVLAGGLLLVAAAIALSSRRIYGLQRQVRRAERLGQYTLADKIGEGGMGAVYTARHAFLRRPTAVKLIRSGHANPAMLARFEREVQLTSQLTHPNTIAIYDYGRTPEGIFYYAMEYLPGLPLDRVIRDDGPQPEARVVHVVKQICASLAEAHRISLVHRDVKPANVMLCERGGTYDVVKVLDFGLVKELNAANDPGVTTLEDVVGTPLYMAPEGVVTATNVTPRSDVYAVGAVAYALLTGQNVFSGKSAVEVIGHHLHTAPVPPSQRLGAPVSPVLERLILACLAKRPEDRPADAGAVLTALDDDWNGAAWTQRQARVWWETRAPSMLAARRAAEESLSRGPMLEVDVASRARSSTLTGDSLPELDLERGRRDGRSAEGLKGNAMTRTAWICLVVAASTTTSAFGGTSFSSTWKSPDARPGTFQGKKVVAVFINTEEALRQGIEDSPGQRARQARSPGSARLLSHSHGGDTRRGEGQGAARPIGSGWGRRLPARRPGARVHRVCGHVLQRSRPTRACGAAIGATAGRASTTRGMSRWTRSCASKCSSTAWSRTSSSGPA
jgi:serine/threonine protein kinase